MMVRNVCLVEDSSTVSVSIKRVSKLRMSGVPVKRAFWLSVSAPLEDDILWYISH